MPAKKLQFDVALSFAGEDRPYVEKVANHLRRMELRVFYDKYESVTLWGKNLYDHLRTVYSDRARFVVLFISKHYAEKLWPNHERQSALERALKERKEYILPVRIDSTRLPGLLGTVGYTKANDFSPHKLAAMIKTKVGHIHRPAFWPDYPDMLYRELRAKGADARARVNAVAFSFFDTLKLMTVAERHLLFLAARHGCTSHLPRCSHVELGYLGRVARMSADKILSTFARLDCLGVRSRLCLAEHSEEGKLGEGERYLEWEFNPRLSRRKYGTDVVVAVVDAVHGRLCPNCAPRALKILDFSVLSRRIGFAERHTKRYTRKTSAPKGVAAAGAGTHRG